MLCCACPLRVNKNMRIKSLSVSFHIENFLLDKFWSIEYLLFHGIGVADMGQANNLQINGLIIMHWKENVEII